MTRPLRNIALYSSSLARAGQERVVSDLALGFHERGHAVTVLSFLGGELEAELLGAGIHVRVLDRDDVETFRPSRLASLRAAIRMAFVLRRRRIEVLDVHGLGAHRVAAFACRLAGTPVRSVVFHSNYPELRTDNPRFVRRTRRQLRSFSHFVAITQSIADLALETGIVRRGDISVIPNGVRIVPAAKPRSRSQIRRDLGFADADRLAILVARFRALKNHRVAVAAMRAVVLREPSIHLLLVGDGPEEASVRSLCEEYGLGANVHFLGRRDDVPELLAAADLFVLPSDYEGLPISLLEAMSAGLPTVASDVPGIRDAVSADPGCARLVAPRDEAALAAAILAAFADPGWLEDAGGRASRLAREQYSAEGMVEHYLSMHERLLEGPRE